MRSPFVWAAITGRCYLGYLSNPATLFFPCSSPGHRFSSFTAQGPHDDSIVLGRRSNHHRSRHCLDFSLLLSSPIPQLSFQHAEHTKRAPFLCVTSLICRLASPFARPTRPIISLPHSSASSPDHSLHCSDIPLHLVAGIDTARTRSCASIAQVLSSSQASLALRRRYHLSSSLNLVPSPARLSRWCSVHNSHATRRRTLAQSSPEWFWL